jgi:hypothetical protein
MFSPTEALGYIIAEFHTCRSIYHLDVFVIYQPVSALVQVITKGYIDNLITFPETSTEGQTGNPYALFLNDEKVCRQKGTYTFTPCDTINIKCLELA